MIISYLSQLFRESHSGEQFKLYYKDELNLEPYTTREKDKEKGISKIPKEDFYGDDIDGDDDGLSDDSNTVLSNIYFKSLGRSRRY